MVRGGMAWRPLSLPVLPWPAFSRSGPLESPAGTVAVIAVAEFTVKLALVPLNRTALAPVKLVPLIVTLVPTGPLLGVKLATVGGLALETVTVTGLDDHRTPSTSLATAVSVCEALLAVVVF